MRRTMVKLDPQLVDELADSAADAQESMDQTVGPFLFLWLILVSPPAPPGHKCPGYTKNEKPAEAGS
jgi:hypothetical protein